MGADACGDGSLLGALAALGSLQELEQNLRDQFAKLGIRLPSVVQDYATNPSETYQYARSRQAQ